MKTEVSKFKTNYKSLCSLAGFPKGYKYKSKDISFEDLRKAVRIKGVKSQSQYRNIYKKMGWPSIPDRTYKKEWKDWYDFFGKVRSDFPCFEDLKKAVRIKGVKSQPQYKKVYKKMGWPSIPDRIYKKEWKDWYDLLGTVRTVRPDFPSFEDLKKAVRAKGVKLKSRYNKIYKKMGWPCNPDRIYRKEWKDWYDLFGTVRSDFPSYEKLKKAVRIKGVKSQPQYNKIYKKMGWPSIPDRTYKKEWKDWYDFFGKVRSDFPCFEDLKKAVRIKGVKSQPQYKKVYKKMGWPSIPDRIYKKEWKDCYDFFGKVRSDFPCFEDLKKAVIIKGVKSQPQYKKVYKKMGWPSNPNRTYEKEWINWYDFLGKTK
jgi:predicted mannosyl-3-phosphoglycerate phosphatase (HAD superfamily)